MIDTLVQSDCLVWKENRSIRDPGRNYSVPDAELRQGLRCKICAAHSLHLNRTTEAGHVKIRASGGQCKFFPDGIQAPI